MIKELIKDPAALSVACESTTTDDAQVAEGLVDTLTSLDGAACLAANQVGVARCIVAYLDDDDKPHVMHNPKMLLALVRGVQDDRGAPLT